MSIEVVKNTNDDDHHHESEPQSQTKPQKNEQDRGFEEIEDLEEIILRGQNSSPRSEEGVALKEVQELLDVVEDLLDRDSRHQEQQKIGQYRHSDGSEKDCGTSNKNSSNGGTEKRGNRSSLSRQSQLLRKRLVEEVSKSRRRISKTIHKLQEQQNKAQAKINKQIRKHPAIIKTRDATRRVITGSQDTRIRDYCVIPRVVRVLDKYTFTLGVLGIMVTEYMMLIHPQYFRYYYVAIMTPLLILRYIMYHRCKWQYFMFDFCYWVNALCFVLILLPNLKLPLLHPNHALFIHSIDTFGSDNTGGIEDISMVHHNEIWWQTLFICANGPLITAIVTWNNSLVFHSVDKVTSIYIHILPSLLSYCERWEHSHGGCNGYMTMRGHLLYPIFFYMIWQITYLVQTEYIDREKLDADPELSTSLRYLTQATKMSIHQNVLKLCRSIGVMAPKETFHPPTMKVKLIFVTFQFAYTLVVFLPGRLYYHYKALHLFLILFVVTFSVYNGARYYIQVFSKIYEKRYADSLQSSSSKQQQNATITNEKHTPMKEDFNNKEIDDKRLLLNKGRASSFRDITPTKKHGHNHEKDTSKYQENNDDASSMSSSVFISTMSTNSSSFSLSPADVLELDVGHSSIIAEEKKTA